MMAQLSGDDVDGGTLNQPSTILYLAANPVTLRRVQLDEECRAIEHNIRTAKYRSLVRLRSSWAARADDLLQVLNEESPLVLHFSGHGAGEQGLCFQTDDGRAASVTAEALAQVMEATGGSVRFVVLNACYSEVQARALITHVPCVIGMPAAIGDTAAITYAASLYRALAFGKSVANAHRQGLAALALQAPQGELRDAEPPTQLSTPIDPILLVRPGSDPNDIYLVHPRRQRRLPALVAALASLVLLGGAGAGVAWWRATHREPPSTIEPLEKTSELPPSTSFAQRIRLDLPPDHLDACIGSSVRLHLGSDFAMATVAANREAVFPGISQPLAGSRTSAEISCAGFEADEDSLHFVLQADATHAIALHARCGNNRCDPGESHRSCPRDCPLPSGPCTQTSGNWILHERSTICPRLDPDSATARAIANEELEKNYICKDIYRCI